MVHIPDSKVMTKQCEWCGEEFSYIENSNSAHAPRKFCNKNGTNACAVAYHRAKRAQRKLAVKEIKDVK